ncbi:MAG: hypothetical protein JSU62_11855 [Gammaproteobacteria bacterium]|jgi:hypothetical protein|nr:MAG: hypothetical protein JSU62_11855 [Gammaproteobacteria bacterium]
MKKCIERRIALLLTGGLGLISSAAVASPVISELFYDAPGSDAGLAFVELFGTPGDSLDGLLLEGINGSGGTVYKTIGLGGVFPLDGVFVIGDESGGSTQVANADLIADVDFQNGPDSVVLRDAAAVLDAVAYGNFGVGDVSAGEGSAAPAALAGSSIARFNPWLDTGDNGADFVLLATPTPGVVPSVSAVPLPASAVLFASGLLSLLVSRRGLTGA